MGRGERLTISHTPNNLCEVIRNLGMMHHLKLPYLALALTRQLAVDKQVGRFQKVGFLSELFDRVPPMHQETLISIDKGDLGAYSSGVEIGWVEDTNPIGRIVGVHAILCLWCLALEGFEGGCGNGVVCYRDDNCFAGSIIGHR